MRDPFWRVGNDLAVDFANTVVGTADRAESLRGWGDVIGFLAGTGALDPGEASRVQRDARGRGEEGEALASALRLRGAVREIVAALAAGAAVPEGAVRRLNGELGAVPTTPQLVRGQGGWRLEQRAVAHSWREVLAPIARAAAELIANPRGSIRKCADPTCVLCFRDASRAQARRWCSMSACGNRAKVAAYARRAGETS